MNTMIPVPQPGHCPCCRGCEHLVPEPSHPCPCARVAWVAQRHVKPSLVASVDGQHCDDHVATPATWRPVAPEPAPGEGEG